MKTLVIGASDLNADWIGNLRNGEVRREQRRIYNKVRKRAIKPDKKSGTGEKPKRRT